MKKVFVFVGGAALGWAAHKFDLLGKATNAIKKISTKGEEVPEPVE